jgi:hypothetical protein
MAEKRIIDTTVQPVSVDTPVSATVETPKISENPPPIPVETKTVEIQPMWKSLGHIFVTALFSGFLAYQAATVTTTKKIAPQLQSSISQTQVLTEQVKTATQTAQAAQAKAATLEAKIPVFPTIEKIKKYYFAMKKPDGTFEVRTGGSISWRYNNPGKLLYDNFAKTHKAIGFDGSFAIFASEDDGMAALESYLFESDFGYKDLSLENAIKKFAPTKDGYNPRTYLNYILSHSKVKAKTVLSTMTADDRADVLTAIRDYEHWIVGNVTNVTDLSKGK